MPKKNSAKKSKSKQASPDVEQKKQNHTVKETGNEIDGIFSGKKRKTPRQESPNVEEGKPTPAVKKSTNEIDEIFAGKKKKKKPKQEQPEKGAEDVNSKLKKSKRDKEDDFSDPPSRSKKRTADGLAIYTEEELGIGKSDAGGTPLCPFDCSCCF